MQNQRNKRTLGVDLCGRTCHLSVVTGVGGEVDIRVVERPGARQTLRQSRCGSIYQLQPLRSCLMRCRLRESSINVASRRTRVSSRFALVTQRAACLR